MRHGMREASIDSKYGSAIYVKTPGNDMSLKAPSKKTPKKRGIIERVWITISEPEAAGIFGGLLFLFLVGVLMVSVANGVLFVIACALVAGVVATASYVIGVGVSTFDDHETRMIRARAVAWAKSAHTEEEQENRFSSIHALGAGAALMGAGLDIHQPLVNIDGSPMMGMVDIHGNPYGVTSYHDYGSHDYGSHDFGSHDYGSHDFGSHDFGSHDFGGSSSDTNSF